MPSEGFFHRWSRLKADTAVPAPAPDHAAGPPVAAPADVAPPARTSAAGSSGQARRPTMEDVAHLDAAADYSAFVARGVDQSVRRSAMKKLFSDPHFNTGDGLDLYMGDYNKPDPVSAAMLAALKHSESYFAQAFPEPADAAPPAAGAGDAPQADPSQPSPGPAMANHTAAAGGTNEGNAT